MFARLGRSATGVAVEIHRTPFPSLCNSAFAQVATTDFDAGGFRFALINSSQTLQSLSPGDDTSFSFVPDDSNVQRDGVGFHDVGAALPKQAKHLVGDEVGRLGVEPLVDLREAQRLPGAYWAEIGCTMPGKEAGTS